ncbi:MAG TPA: zinc-dependent metalloprotease [Verrucomicrobiae bacterium]
MKNIPRLAAVMALVFASFFCGVRLTAAQTNAPAKSSAPPPPLEAADGSMVGIPKAGLGKDYQFTSSIIPQEGELTSTGLSGRIVRFELFPDGVDMYESTPGFVVTSDLPSRRLLATFPIISQDGQRVVVDFNKGMRRVFTDAWTSEGGLDFSEHDRVLEVPDSRVFEVRLANDRLIVRQSVQARSRDFEQDVENRYEMRYFISPYKPGALEGKEISPQDFRYVRYFETQGHIEESTGRISADIARFDIRQPVVFYYSANTPSNYIQPVMDGILYWNSAFGKEIVQAKKAPEGVTAPDADHNVIQWVPWDLAGSAYADDLMDPVTGQSEHGQAYITSAFAFGGRASARQLLRSMEDLAEPKKDDKKKEAALRRAFPFQSSGPHCDIDPVAFAQQMAGGLKDVLASDELTDAAVLRISQDYVREVVAHEVGHIMGLRHNFASSLAGTLKQTELDDWFKAYVAGKPLDGFTNKYPSESVMDYNVLKAGVFIGWRMRTVKVALPDDRAAIAWGYFDSPDVREKKMYFATDQDIRVYGDVRQFDYGDEPVVSDYSGLAEAINLLPNGVIESFIRARAPHNPRDRVPLEQVDLSPTYSATRLTGEFGGILSWFRADTRSFRVESKFDFIGELNRKERMQAHWTYLTNQIEELGGLDRTVFSFMPLDLKLDLKDKPTNAPAVERLNGSNLTERLEKLLTNASYSTFVGLDDKKYSFTKEERALIVQRGKKFFEEVDKDVVHRVCERLTSAPRNLDLEANGYDGDDDVVAKLDKRIIDLAKIVITAQDETNRIEGKLDKATVSVPKFKYDQATRVEAAKMLAPNAGSYKTWADEAKSDINEALKKEVDAALGLDHFNGFKITLLSRPLQEWYQEQQDLLAMLPK